MTLLSDLVFQRTYAATKADGRKETHEETVTRVKNMHLKKFPGLAEGIEQAFQYVYQGLVVPSMRSFQFAGPAIERENARLYNCSFANLTDFTTFAELMYLLLCGTGTGYSVQERHISWLPVISEGEDKSFLIFDSRESWCDSVKALLNNPKVIFDYSLIREAGSPVSSGGTASGKEPLMKAHEKIRSILVSAIGRKLLPLECHDIMCFLADSVIVGGVRRSAMVVLFDKDCEEMLTCKAGNWWELNSQRGRANNSAVLHRKSKTIKKDIRNILEKCFASNAGEPGLFLTNCYDWGSNPCMEIALQSHQFCVAPSTPLITKTGIFPIGSLENKEVDVWNGTEWSSVIVRQTSPSEPLVRVTFGDGSYIECTESHRFSVKDRFQKEYSEVLAKDLMNFSKYSIHTEQFQITHENGTPFKDAYTLGVAVGDGCVTKKYNHVVIDLYGDKMNLPITGCFGKITTKPNYNVPCRRVVTDLNSEDVIQARENITELFGNSNRDSILSFIAGLADTDGSNTSTGSIRIYGNENLIRGCQLLLTKCGIRSSVSLMSEVGEKTNFGVRKYAMWYLTVVECSEIPCHRLNTSSSHKARFKGKHQNIKSVEFLNVNSPVYCFKEHKTGKAVFNNTLTYQCNLTEVLVQNCMDSDDFCNAVKSAAFIGTLQASYTNFGYLSWRWKQVTENAGLLGVSLTGQAMKPELLTAENLQYAAAGALYINAHLSQSIGIKPAARITTTKPSGSTSAANDCTSGVHAAHAKYYLRRVRVEKSNPLAKYLIEKIGMNTSIIEDDVFNPDQIVVAVPYHMENAIYRDEESAIDLLERMKHLNKNWISKGHRSGKNQHNVSLTVNYKEHEKVKIANWIVKNRDFFTGISLLPFDSGSYVQAPFETIDEATYNAKLDEVEKFYLNFEDVSWVDISDDRLGETACGGGACEIR